MFLWQDEEGNFEIVDGSQRLRTLTEFIDGQHRLSGLELLTDANGFYYSDFEQSRQRRFNSQSIRGIILDNDTSPSVRTEMFSRINTGGKTANEAEIRRGSLPGPITDLIKELAENEQFTQMTPLSAKLIASREREELVVRFFAYLAGFEDPRGELFGYKDQPRRYIYDYLNTENLKAVDDGSVVSGHRRRFMDIIGFIDNTFPNGFLKPGGRTQVPRVRYEAISIGSALALADRPELANANLDISAWIDGMDFNQVTTSDGANVRSKLVNRIRYVKEKLCGSQI